MKPWKSGTDCSISQNLGMGGKMMKVHKTYQFPVRHFRWLKGEQSSLPRAFGPIGIYFSQ
ncbi:hypothetical protein C5167_043874 [Papaver somniferum]|uniref:Uncharacterized protein n=1 Tax=Papaver somniferum TaxID=3469 RepID=A0A4Y7L7Y1_PAPSO|nr:hypothetical protein C5167_043874 [Papaver somniferum]